MYRAYQIFLMLLKLDVFFVFGFGIQFLVLVIKTNDPEFALTIAALPLMMITLALAVYGKKNSIWNTNVTHGITISTVFSNDESLAVNAVDVVVPFVPSETGAGPVTKPYSCVYWKIE
ncbi:hypothetical protein BDK51DRAFT_31667 [Blyttiomyces helicus]|uniref:Uncharacterized protein n=1 Tax=Blyttiomyces helicus TaxID=388810 RepID=A0A4V1IPP9_9FUNG|nr:hypothetical protein BDK51DRAFT_31667 [Blyttiomyces helicus]|eukprot:RKO83817.1 hypothetical protein BDK51DRAFT_31667 [Blyttiomyces helicus]